MQSPECKIKQWRSCFSDVRKEARSKLEKAEQVIESNWFNMDYQSEIFIRVMHVLDI